MKGVIKTEYWEHYNKTEAKTCMVIFRKQYCQVGEMYAIFNSFFIVKLLEGGAEHYVNNFVKLSHCNIFHIKTSYTIWSA